MLKSIQGEAILPLYEICRGRRQGRVYLITELYDITLDMVITSQSPLSLVVLSFLLHI